MLLLRQGKKNIESRTSILVGAGLSSIDLVLTVRALLAI